MIKTLILVLFSYSIMGCNTTPKKDNYFQKKHAISLEKAFSQYQFNKPVHQTSSKIKIKKAPNLYSNNQSQQSSQSNLWSANHYSHRLNLHGSRPEVIRQINYFKQHPSFIKRSSQRAKPYLHFIVNQLTRANLPIELAALPFIESGYNPNAVSHAKAEGVWQFIPSTAQHFGLKSNYWYDGRRDIFASTQAAILYLKQLNKEFSGDWLLTLAAYNCGPYCVKNAQKKNIKAGKRIDFWSLQLPTETKTYVPRFLAINKIIRNSKRYGLSLAQVKNQPYFDILQINKPLNLIYIAKKLNIPSKSFAILNAGLKQQKIDPKYHRYLLIPTAKTQDFLQLTTTSQLQRSHKTAQFKSVNTLGKKVGNTPTKNSNKTSEYIVKSGDSLKSISLKFKVSIKNILHWNKQLNQNQFLRPNQRIIIYTKRSKKA